MYTEFPCLKIFPLHNFQKMDFLCILAHTFCIGLLLLMGDTVQKHFVYILQLAVHTVQRKWISRLGRYLMAWIHFCSLWFTLVHFSLLGFPWVYLGSLGLTLFHFGSLWFTGVHIGFLGLILVYFESLGSTYIHLGSFLVTYQLQLLFVIVIFQF